MTNILVPKGFQGRELMRGHPSNLESGVPQDGECLKCRGTGAIIEKLWLENFEIVDGKITKATPKMAFSKCKCYKGQFWLRFHPLNVQARVFPKFEKEIHAMLEQEKADLIRKSGGTYEPGSDSFLDDIGYKAPKTQKILSLDDILRERLIGKT